MRNQPYYHVRLDKTVRFSSPTQFMAQRKSTIDEAYPGDIVGLPDNGIFKIGDTLTEGEKIHFRGLPSFSPVLFKYIENDDPMKSKQFQKGLEQLMNEGVAQLFINQFNGRRSRGYCRVSCSSRLSSTRLENSTMPSAVGSLFTCIRHVG